MPGPGMREGGRVLPGADVEAMPGPGMREGGRVLPGADVEAMPGPGMREGGSKAPVEVPGPAGGGGPSTASPGTEVPGAPSPEPGGPEESVRSEVGPSPTAEPRQGESLPASDRSQIAILNATGEQAVNSATKASAGAKTGSAIGVFIAVAGFGLALRQAMSRAVQWRSKILAIAPKVVTNATRMLTNLRTNASLSIRNIALKVKSVADAAKGVIAWARQAVSAALASARSFAKQLRSALGGAGDAVMKFLSNLLAPARKALGQLLKSGSEVLLEGIKQVRVAAAGAVAWVKEEVGTRLEAALTKITDLVGAAVQVALKKARRTMTEIDQKVAAAREQLKARMFAARMIVILARSRANERIGASAALLATAVANGYGRLRTGRGRRAFRQQATVWRRMVKSLTTSVRRRFVTDFLRVHALYKGGKTAIGAARANARANYGATRRSLTNLETTAGNEASELRASVGAAAAMATGAIDAAVTEGETLIREIAGEGDRDAHQLQELINRAGT